LRSTEEHAMTRIQAKEIWDEWKWWLALVVFPLLLWGAKRYDASKLDERVFTTYVNQQLASEALRDVRDSARQERITSQLRYLICREDFSRQQCLRPDR
jgi:hypothetical protein